MAEVYLRRNQDDVPAELPERIETESWVHPSPSDVADYRRAVEAGHITTMRRAGWASEESAKLDRLEEIVAEADEDGLKVPQTASVVVLAEPQWKPSTEEQVIARAHRMGQTRPVQVHRLLAKNTVDERVQEIQGGKRLLFDAYARRSDAKDADRASVDTGRHRPPALDDASVSDEKRVVLAERHPVGIVDGVAVIGPLRGDGGAVYSPTTVSQSIVAVMR